MRYELQRLHVETGSTFVYVTHDQMEAMTLATQICLINNGVLQQYEAPLEVYHHPANLFVADFVGNPSINFVEAKGAQGADGALDLTVLGGLHAKFRPAKPLDLSKWFANRDEQAAKRAAELKEKASQKGYVEKGNKDEVFRYHIARLTKKTILCLIFRKSRTRTWFSASAPSSSTLPTRAIFAARSTVQCPPAWSRPSKFALAASC